MINQKAPKDWTFKEAIAELEKIDSRIERGDESKYYSLKYLKELYKQPAPNPFTPDQLAWMRVEQVYRKINYAACERHGTIVFFEDKPIKNPNAVDRWASDLGYREVVGKDYTFLADVLSVDDPEPLCFADYAPLEEK